MVTKRNTAGRYGRLTACAVIVIALMAMPLKSGAGTWTALATAPPVGVNSALVLSDGTILTDNGSGQCARLTPDIHGSYINGTWTQVASMNYDRLFFSTQMLTNGTVFVAGGEYGKGHDHAEIYDPLRNVWTRIYPDPVPAVGFSDAISETLPNGNVLDAPVSEFGGCLIYNVASNNWQTAASTANQNEVCWVKLANDNILTINTASTNAEHYVPSLNVWDPDNSLPVPLYDSIAELGPGFLLPNGNVFYIGATTNTAIYTPGSTVTSAGTWTVGPAMVFGTNFLGGVDAPAAMMPDGNIFCALGAVGGFNSQTFFYEYDYVANSFTQVNAPSGGATYNAGTFTTSMLDLPDGNVLFIGGQNTTSLYVYAPSGTPLAAGQPAINSITENADGSYQLIGTNLTGISQGAAYGDDEQMNSNYPLVRMTNNATGNVYYARTFNWNSTSVQTGSRVITTELTLPQNLPSGAYSLVAEANGNPSAPTTFTYAPPSVPSGLAATSGSNGFVQLTWNASAGATAYNVKRSSTVAGYYSTLATVTGLSFTNFGVTNGLTYYYKVAAIGSGGPSSDCAATAATPAGLTFIPGATQVNLSANYNRYGIYTDGDKFTTGGFDAGGTAFSATLLGTNLLWHNLVFDFGPSNAVDVISCTGQTINLPPGQFNTLQILAAAVNGSQASQTFTVTYTDNSTATFTQNFSDWAVPQSYPGEFTVMTMPYRDDSDGSQQTLNVSVDGYVFVLDQTRTVKSITVPNNSNVNLMAMGLANDDAEISLTADYNRPGIYSDGTTFTNPATGGLDGDGNAYSATLMENSLTWSNCLFAFGPFDATNVISCAGQTITLPPGNYAQLQMLAAAVNGAQASQEFTITYTNSTQTIFVQNLSDWASPANYSGESRSLIMSYRNASNGTTPTSTRYLYGYSFKLNPSRTVQSFRLPSDANVEVIAMSLVPEWRPAFGVNPLTFPGANAGQPYSANIATNASELNGDTLTFALVSGPSWLTVAPNGALSGTPANTNADANTFLISATDTGGLSSTDTVNIFVTGAPSFTENPFTLPGIVVGQNYSGTIATNATDPNTGDTPTFSLLSGPSWLSVAANGALSGEPPSANVGTNTFIVSVTDQGGLSTSATMFIPVTATPPILPQISLQSGGLMISWSGGITPYQLQMTTNLANPNWQDVGSPIGGTNLLIAPSNSAAFYRIVGQ
ncbi:MAG TPA: putative Ig domain-containing protein [Candidatus Acidoferrales bacterium]|nr:putative Ig domain-containing protein [Candidatus Acidoferrales bacterium]